MMFSANTHNPCSNDGSDWAFQRRIPRPNVWVRFQNPVAHRSAGRFQRRYHTEPHGQQVDRDRWCQPRFLGGEDTLEVIRRPTS